MIDPLQTGRRQECHAIAVGLAGRIVVGDPGYAQHLGRRQAGDRLGGGVEIRPLMQVTLR